MTKQTSKKSAESLFKPAQTEGAEYAMNPSKTDNYRSAEGYEKKRTLFVFCDHSTTYAVPPKSVIQVLAKTNPTPLPFTPAWLDGVVSVRGEILPVLDLAKYFQFPSKSNKHLQRLILLGWENNNFIVWSSRIIGLEPIAQESLEQPMENLPRALAGNVEAQFRMDDQVVYLLDLTRLLKESKERVIR